MKSKNDYDQYKEWLFRKNFQKIINNFEKKYKDKKILIYGAGIIAQAIFENFDLSKLNIVAIIDNKFSNNKFVENHTDFKGYPAIAPYEINDYEFDVILVSIYRFNKIKKILNDYLLIDKDKNVEIIDFLPKSIFEKLTENFK